MFIKVFSFVKIFFYCIYIKLTALPKTEFFFILPTHYIPKKKVKFEFFSNKYEII